MILLMNIMLHISLNRTIT